jgi:hypothetical protein
MAYGIFSGMNIKGVFKFRNRYLFDFRDILFGGLNRKQSVRSYHKNFHPIAGRNQNHFGKVRIIAEIIQSGFDLLPGKSKAFPQLNRSGFMI